MSGSPTDPTLQQKTASGPVPQKSRRLRHLGMVLLLLVGMGIGYRSVQRIQRQLQISAACDAAAEKDWDRTIQLTEGLTGPDPDGRVAAECRCQAHIEKNQLESCIQVLEPILASSDSGDWLPDPSLVTLVVGYWRDRGLYAPAAQLAHRASLAHPDRGLFLYLEFTTRSMIEDEAKVADEMAERLEKSGRFNSNLRVLLARVYQRRGDIGKATALIGETPPGSDDPEGESWYTGRADLYAQMGNIQEVARTHELWKASGANPKKVFTNYALTLSLANLMDPKTDTLTLLEKAVELGDEVGDAKLQERVYMRYVSSLVVVGDFARAEAAYNKGRERYELADISLEELKRNQMMATEAPISSGERNGKLRFIVRNHEVGSALLLSPDVDAPADEPLMPLTLDDQGSVLVTRQVSLAPQWWVYRDPMGRTRASGSVWVGRDQLVEVQIEPGAIPADGEPLNTQRPAADGRTRVFTVILDCGEWRIVQYLMARGDLPVLAYLRATGWSGVLSSIPAYTAAAMKALTWPSNQTQRTTVGALYEVGIQLQMFFHRPDNPLSPLRWIMPDRQDFFSTIGAANQMTANLLFSHGSIEAGRNAEIIGPFGKSNAPLTLKAHRAISPEELQRFPGIRAVTDPVRRLEFQETAAAMDATREIARDHKVSCLMVRLERLDTMTHGTYAEATRGNQENGAPVLFWMYRYIDYRVGELLRVLDEDDILIVMSDHGAKTSLEHDERAMFLMIGKDIVPQRLSGNPAIGGVARLIADLLDVPTDWPDHSLKLKRD